MNESRARVWKKIACFYGLTMLGVGFFSAFMVRAGKMEAGGLLFVTGAMWSSGLAALATKKIFGEKIRDLPWRWGESRFAWLGYLIPLAYTVPVYVFTWLTGLGGFNTSALSQTAADLGWQTFPPSVVLILFFVFNATLGMVAKTSRALGEEIGWRGFLVPELSKVVGFRGVGFISGMMWAVYHYPAMLFSDYHGGGPPWYSLICFTIMVIASSFIMAWLTLRAQSLWPAAIFHGSHNLFIQTIFTPLTSNTGYTSYIIDEFGIGLVITTIIGVIIVCWKRGELPTPATVQ